MIFSLGYFYNSLQIFTIKKIPIKLHFTLIIVFFLISWTLATGFMPHYYPNLTTSQYWIMGIIGAIVLFVSIYYCMNYLIHFYQFDMGFKSIK